MLADLERAFDRLDDLLGLRPPRKIEVVIYDAQIFDRHFAGLFRFSAAGFYHGVIRVRGDTQLHAGLSRVLHHELVHAALDAAAPSFAYPAWLNEGLAEWFEARALGKRRFNQWEWDALARARRAGVLLPIATLSAPSFVRMDASTARLAYLQSYGMIDYLVRHYGEGELSRFCADLLRSRNLQRSLARVYRLDLGQLEARFAADFG